MSIKLAIFALLLTIPALGCAGEQLTVLSERDFAKYWRPVGPDVVHFDLEARSIKFHYGCVNLGFIVEKDGSVSAPLRLLSYSFDQPFKSGPSDTTPFAQFGQMLPKFSPANGEGQAVYTSRSIPIRNGKFSKTLTPGQSERLDSALRDACRVEDLAARLTTGSKEAELLPLTIDIDSVLSTP
jgi:hypothetical protein